MPEFISVNDYISEVKDDISSPPTSNFVSKMPLCRQTVNELEEVRTQIVTNFYKTCQEQPVVFWALSWRGRLVLAAGRVCGAGQGACGRLAENRQVAGAGAAAASMPRCVVWSGGGILGFQRGTLYGYYVYVDARPRVRETRGVAVVGWPLTSLPCLL